MKFSLPKILFTLLLSIIIFSIPSKTLAAADPPKAALSLTGSTRPDMTPNSYGDEADHILDFVHTDTISFKASLLEWGQIFSDAAPYTYTIKVGSDKEKDDYNKTTFTIGSNKNCTATTGDTLVIGDFNCAAGVFSFNFKPSKLTGNSYKNGQKYFITIDHADGGNAYRTIRLWDSDFSKETLSLTDPSPTSPYKITDKPYITIANIPRATDSSGSFVYFIKLVGGGGITYKTVKLTIWAAGKNGNPCKFEYADSSSPGVTPFPNGSLTIGDGNVACDRDDLTNPAPTLTFRAKLDPALFRYDASQPEYQFSLNVAGGRTDKPFAAALPFSVKSNGGASGITLEASSSRIMNGEKVTLTATGCPVGSKITFACESDNCDEKSVDATSPTTEYTMELGTDNETTYVVNATCTAGNVKSNDVSIIVNKEGQERTEVIPLPADANVPLTFTVYGTEKNHCYFFKIKDLNTNTWVEPPGGRILHGICDGEDGIDRNSNVAFGDDRERHEAEFYAFFGTTQTTTAYGVPGGLPDGKYVFQLYTPHTAKITPCINYGHRGDCVADTHHTSADLEFIVGIGFFEVKKPPLPPCIVASMSVSGECTEVNTAFGPLKIDLPEFTKSIFTILLSISGGLILLIIIRSGYLLMFSQGNAEKVKEAQDRLTSAIIGFLFLIFSLVILETIGVDILHIPGFGS